MEARFGHDFSDVRVRHEPRATRELRASGFTRDREVVLNSPDLKRAGPRAVLAHELVHVLQQRGPRALAGSSQPLQTRRAPRYVARHPDPPPGQATVAPPRTPDFAPLWRSFQFDMVGTPTPAVIAQSRLVLNALDTATRQERQTQGLELALWFQRNSMDTEARRALLSVEGAWTVGAVVREGGGVPIASTIASGSGPSALIESAEGAARRDQHETAFRFFGLAFLFLQMQLRQETERRGAALERPGAAQTADFTRSLFVYPTFTQLYDSMRRILGFYLGLEREAVAARQPQRAGEMHLRAVQLEQHLRDTYAWSGPSLITEVSRVQTRVGPGLRIHGANRAETDVTPFMGLPTPAETGERSYQWQSTENIAQSLSGQAQFLNEIQLQPEIVREFGTRTIDMNNLDQRLHVWRTMYGVFERQHPGPAALDDLMALIGRYLRAFTIHTEYNIRDWGENYLTSEMPTDLAGRAERDCGVYALTVAHEVFRTARTARPRLNLSFEITVVPGHVVLVVYDRGTNGFYLVNNDRISERRPGGQAEAEAAVAPAMAGTFGRPDFVTPAIRMELGTTALSTEAFRTQAWEHYREASGWSLGAEQRTGPGDTRTQSELLEAGHRTFYERQAEFDRGALRLSATLESLSTELSRLPDADQLTRLRAQLPRLAATARNLGTLFIALGPAAPIGVDPARPRLIGRLRALKRYLFSWQPMGTPHPLARTAMALLRLQQLGGTLSAQDQALVTFCDSIAAFHSDLDRYRPRVATSSF